MKSDTIQIVLEKEEGLKTISRLLNEVWIHVWDAGDRSSAVIVNYKSGALDYCCFLLRRDYRNDSQEAWPHWWHPFLYGRTSMFRLSIVCVEAGRNGWHWHLIKAIIQPVHSLVARSKQESPKCRACMILPNNSIRCFTINKRLNFESNNKGSNQRYVKLILMPLVRQRLAEGSAMSS